MDFQEEAVQILSNAKKANFFKVINSVTYVYIIPL